MLVLGNGGQIVVAGLAEGVESAVAAATDGAFVDAEDVGDPVPGGIAVAASTFQIQQHPQVLHRGDSVPAGPGENVDDVQSVVLRFGGVQVRQRRVVWIDEEQDRLP